MASAPPRRYTIRLEVEVCDLDGRADRGEPQAVVARADQVSREVRGRSDGEALCNLFRFGLREGWISEE